MNVVYSSRLLLILIAGREALRLELERFWRYCAISYAAGSVLVVLGATQVHAQYAVFRREEVSWSDCFIWAGVQWYTWAPLVPIVAVFSQRYRFDGTSAVFKSATLHSMFALVFCIAHSFMQALGVRIFASAIFPSPDQGLRASVLRILISQIHWQLMSYAMIVATVHFALYLRRSQAESIARKESQLHAVRAQLATLKKQMQPHFLFNSLNALVSMLQEGSGAQQFAIRLADMLRIILRDSERATASLREEMHLVEIYLEIERARFGSRLAAKIEIPSELLETRLPSLLLQPLIENAITHGIGQSSGLGDIVIRANRTAEIMTIEITNSCAPVEAKSLETSGITFSNCRRRLALLYGPTASFEAAHVRPTCFRTAIAVPLSQ